MYIYKKHKNNSSNAPKEWVLPSYITNFMAAFKSANWNKGRETKKGTHTSYKLKKKKKVCRIYLGEMYPGLFEINAFRIHFSHRIEI